MTTKLWRTQGAVKIASHAVEETFLFESYDNAHFNLDVLGGTSGRVFLVRGSHCVYGYTADAGAAFALKDQASVMTVAEIHQFIKAH